MERDENLLARLELLVERLEQVLGDHETRIRTLEKRSWKLAGAIGLFVFLVPVLLHFVG